MKKHDGFKRVVVSIMLCMLVCCPAITAFAESKETLDDESVKYFVDALIEEKMEAYHVPACSVAIVYGDDLVFTEAYGYENIEENVLADENVSLFSIGSMTKTFTYTAAMQLYEQGKLDLDAPVSQYIDFEIDKTYDTPILVSDLFNHTAGYEEILYGIQAGSYEEIKPLEEWLETNLPNQVNAPGTYTAYSNHGITLLALVIQNISGLSINEYIETNILEPLKMDHTVIDQKPVPHLVKGYEYNPKTESFILQKDEFWNVGPAGAMKLTAVDAAKYMSAHLNGGEYDGVSIMKPETMALMHSTSFTYDKRLPGMAHGLIEGNYNGHEYVSHGGTTSYMHTRFYMYEDLGLGLYITSVTSGARALNSEFCSGFLDHFFDSKIEESVYMDSTDLDRYAGSYHMARSSYTTFEKILRWTNSIEFQTQGSELISSTGQTYRQIEPLYFEDFENSTWLLFDQDEDGKITGLALSGSPITYFERESSLEHSGNLLVIGGFLAGLFILSLLVRFAVWVVNKVKKHTLRKREKRIRLAFNLHVVLVVLAAIGIALVFFTFDGAALMRGDIATINVALTLTTLSLPFTLFSIYLLVVTWKNKCFTLASRVHETLMVVASVLIVSWMIFWNMIGWML